MSSHSTSRGQYVVYFFQVEDSGPIKIGRSMGWADLRFESMQTASPFQLRFLGEICHVPVQAESEIHRRFSHLHIRGEWFRPGPDLLEFIARESVPWEGRQRRRHRKFIVNPENKVSLADLPELSGNGSDVPADEVEDQVSLADLPELSGNGSDVPADEVEDLARSSRDVKHVRNEMILMMSRSKMTATLIAGVFKITDRQVRNILGKGKAEALSEVSETGGPES